MPYDLYDHVAAVPALYESDDGIVKLVRARDALTLLPAAANIRRDPDLIPDIPVQLLLSKTVELPRLIRDAVARSRTPYLFAAGAAHNLGGLCLNGRGYPVRLFVHQGLLDTFNDGPAEFERLFLHEYVHGGEGMQTRSGEVRRTMPWSFRFQQRLTTADRLDHSCFDALTLTDPHQGAFIDYLRRGYDVQDHVSEMFARVATLTMHHVRQTGHLPCRKPEVYGMLAQYGLHGDPADANEVLDNCDADDLALTLATHGKAARSLAWAAMPRLVHAAARLCGYAV